MKEKVTMLFPKQTTGKENQHVTFCKPIHETSMEDKRLTLLMSNYNMVAKISNEKKDKINA